MHSRHFGPLRSPCEANYANLFKGLDLAKLGMRSCLYELIHAKLVILVNAKLGMGCSYCPPFIRPYYRTLPKTFGVFI